MFAELSDRLNTVAQPPFDRDWIRQRRTAADILTRLEAQEGVVLADQVGMGKTFVALSVAVSAILSTKEPGQVLILVPPAVASKWVEEWRKFNESLLLPGREIRCVPDPIRSGEGLLAALDDPPERRAHLIIATHTALTTTLKDSFIQLALLHVATKGRATRVEDRRVIARWSAGQSGLLRDRRLTSPNVARLLGVPPGTWRREWERLTGVLLDDDPVPDSVMDALRRIDLGGIRACVAALPKKWSPTIDSRLRAARDQLSAATQATWRSVLSATDLTLPLLIIDEAHGLKNDQTKKSQLFAPRRPGHESGALTCIFERMLLITATPFELGHRELINVLSRLSAVRARAPGAEGEFETRLAALSSALESAQSAAITLDDAWTALSPEEVASFAGWGLRTPPPDGAGSAVITAWRAAQYAATSRRAMNDALRPWVIRHQREKRRTYWPGDAIELGRERSSGAGLSIPDEIVLPFLLAARAQALAGEQAGGAARPLFAYGIASSFETFRRLGSGEESLDTDLDLAVGDDEDRHHRSTSGAAEWYRREIDALLVDGGIERGGHPKVRATVDRAADLWLGGHKCLVFCWFIRTGRAVEEALQVRVDALIRERAATALGVVASDQDAVDAALGRVSDRILRRGSPSYTTMYDRLHTFFGDCFAGSPGAHDDVIDDLSEIAIRQLRTPGYLVRFSHLSAQMGPDELWAGINGRSPAGVVLLDRWRRFSTRVAGMGDDERTRVFEALRGEQQSDDGDASDAQGRGASLKPVRRAHGGTNRDLRERLTALFNTPFAPELLVASSVMGEGIDLHHECRHVIHHDLDWNPSVLEQRTGRLDRIGALAELEGQDIEVYEPYLAGTHDEKMYRVVKDRAGWFDVVMGRATGGEERATDSEEKRVPLATEIAAALTMDLRSPVGTLDLTTAGTAEP